MGSAACCKSGYTDKISDSIKSAKEFSKSINVEELKQIYNEALKEVNEKNSAVEEKVPVTTPPVQEEVPTPSVKEEKPSRPYDPNLDSNFGSDEEEAYVAPTFSVPAYYVDDSAIVTDAQFEDAFNDMMGETTKTK